MTCDPGFFSPPPWVQPPSTATYRGQLLSCSASTSWDTNKQPLTVSHSHDPAPPSGRPLTNRWWRGLLLPHVPFFQKLTSSVFPSSSYPLASTPATAPSITGIIITEYPYISSHSYPVGIPTSSPRPPQSIIALPEATLHASCSGTRFIRQEVHSWSLATTDTSGAFLHLTCVWGFGALVRQQPVRDLKHVPARPP